MYVFHTHTTQNTGEHSTVSNIQYTLSKRGNYYCAFWERMELHTRPIHEERTEIKCLLIVSIHCVLDALWVWEYDVDFDDYIILSVTVAVVLCV